jgi:hypothetical protein
MSIPKALAKQLDLPVSFTPSGEMVTLREFVKNKEAWYLSLSSLTHSQRAKITAERSPIKYQHSINAISSLLVL